ncbi:uncharacterized protein A1O9_04175 [Exophiala aquamarina CBS 119918]|uniref:DUF676 domain-containing protein n=1 Tax=Exophiala aquamarina CBS 119918 TaxID=1182545 RepID=A0A072PHK8_9EURO|nr:uncharacterized protein A1O9_04175 [Exophiala aquamarina CBS 119918]KEF59331.1 hypothetical protein A1O9_04175 [Exophiala aquamarina CBS 119918]
MIESMVPTIHACTDASPVVDVVLVHELSSHENTVWEQSDIPIRWLRDALPATLPPARLLSYGYDADISLHRPEVSQSSIDANAHQLHEMLQLKRVRADEMIRPIIFMTHSLGGVVVNQALRIAKLKSRRTIFDHCQGVVFLGRSCPTTHPLISPPTPLWKAIYNLGYHAGLVLCQLGCTAVVANYQPTGPRRVADNKGGFSHLDPSPTFFVFAVLGYFLSFMTSYSTLERTPYQTYLLVIGFTLGAAISVYMLVQQISSNVLTAVMPLCLTSALMGCTVSDFISSLSHQADAESALNLMQAWATSVKVPSEQVNGEKL